MLSYAATIKNLPPLHMERHFFDPLIIVYLSLATITGIFGFIHLYIFLGVGWGGGGFSYFH